jgi:regulatory protein
MIITALEPKHGRPGRTDVYADGHLLMTVADSVAANQHLGVGQPVDEARLRAIADAADLAKASELALRYLEPRARTSREIEQRLRRGGYAPGIIEAVLAKLTGLGLVDDTDFARQYVEQKARPAGSRPVGRRRISADLARKGVDRETIDDAVAAVDDDREQELARAAARGRVKQIPSDPQERFAERRRLASFLARRGFGWSVVEPVLREIFGDDD